MRYERERDVLSDVLYFYEQNCSKTYREEYIKSKIEDLTNKVNQKQEVANKYKAMIESGNKDEVIAWKGYKIAKVPIFSHCDEELLKEFI